MRALWSLLVLVLAGAALAGCLIVNTDRVSTPRPTGAKAPYDRLYVFGDSYSDTGYGYVDGNGLTSVGYLAQDMGLAMTNLRAPDWQGKSLNFAVSGAGTGLGGGKEYPATNGAPPPRLSYGMINQGQDFVAQVQAGKIAFDPDKTLFFIAGGLNDSRLTTDQTEANLTQLITMLKGTGGKHFRIAILPQKIPQFATVGTRLDPMLEGLPAKLNASLGIDAKTSRWGAYYDEVIQNPAQFGITNTKDKCAGRDIFNEDTTPCADPDAHFFYHEGHPSTAVHKAVGAKLYQEIVSGG